MLRKRKLEKKKKKKNIAMNSFLYQQLISHLCAARGHVHIILSGGWFIMLNRNFIGFGQISNYTG